MNVINIDLYVIILFFVKNEKNWDIVCLFRDLIYFLRWFRVIFFGLFCGFVLRSLIIFLGVGFFLRYIFCKIWRFWKVGNVFNIESIGIK